MIPTQNVRLELNSDQRQVEDHRTEIHIENGADFPGYGYRLGKQTASQNNSSVRANKSKSCPGSAHRSPINTSRDRNMQFAHYDLSNK